MLKFIPVTFLISVLLISVQGLLAQAAAPEVAKKGADWSPLLGIVLMFAVFFFLIILPQSRKAKKQTEFLSKLTKGDQVVTQGGIYGKIVGIADKVITLEIAQNVKIRVDRQTIAGRDEFAVSESKESKEKAA